MKGLELKKILREDRVNLSELAKALGFDNDQRLHSALNAADVKSGLIEKIAQATNRTVGYYYGEANTSTHRASPSDGNMATLLSMLQKKDEQIDRLMALLEKQTHRDYLSITAEP